MEMASYLAGERWTDHPRCTHPLLAGLARIVNDHTTDDGRSGLIELIPSVIGVTTTDPRADALIAWRCATVALPVVAPDRQKVMAVATLIADRLLADLDATGRGELLAASRDVLAIAPAATQWALRFAGDDRISPARFRRISAPCIVRNAVPGIASAGIPDPDGLLRRLLIDAIVDVGTLQQPAPAGHDPAGDGRRATAERT